VSTRLRHGRTPRRSGNKIRSNHQGTPRKFEGWRSGFREAGCRTSNLCARAAFVRVAPETGCGGSSRGTSEHAPKPPTNCDRRPGVGSHFLVMAPAPAIRIGRPARRSRASGRPLLDRPFATDPRFLGALWSHTTGPSAGNAPALRSRPRKPLN